MGLKEELEMSAEDQGSAVTLNYRHREWTRPAGPFGWAPSLTERIGPPRQMWRKPTGEIVPGINWMVVCIIESHLPAVWARRLSCPGSLREGSSGRWPVPRLVWRTGPWTCTPCPGRWNWLEKGGRKESSVCPAVAPLSPTHLEYRNSWLWSPAGPPPHVLASQHS